MDRPRFLRLTGAALTTPAAAQLLASCGGQAAVEEGIRSPIVPERWRLGPMIGCLADELTASIDRYSILGSQLEVRGGTIVVDGVSIALPACERGVLAHLLGPPGLVVS